VKVKHSSPCATYTLLRTVNLQDGHSQNVKIKHPSPCAFYALCYAQLIGRTIIANMWKLRTLLLVSPIHGYVQFIYRTVIASMRKLRSLILVPPIHCYAQLIWRTVIASIVKIKHSSPCASNTFCFAQLICRTVIASMWKICTPLLVPPIHSVMHS
jgi:hypothetical protein